MNCTRNLIITGLSHFLGISIPQFFNQYWNPSHHGLAHTDAACQCIREHRVLTADNGGIDSGGDPRQHDRSGEIEER
ncbi:hypothetical protein GOBAR_AA09966 [Gossypium barbadense]|uniref:Uncharacterized protein n=1 Tax=Gossypium barbadense TaxID=3634 RepID=A0A2P5Y518_GOSBA|nr:hypothetical protein GOBAR_AA09966 [Gossypium barbadense]